MKRKIPFIGAYLLCFLLACVATFGMCSCDRLRSLKSQDNCDIGDSVLVAQVVDNYFNPAFTDVQSVLAFQKNAVLEHETDSFIRAVNPGVLTNITTVILNRGGTVTLSSIYNEYTSNTSIYDNLPSQAGNTSTPSENDSKMSNTATGEQQDIVSNSSVKQKSTTYKDTTINGKKCQVTTTISEYE